MNVAQEALDPHSLWSLYQRLIALRRLSPALARGDVSLIPTDSADCLLYERTARSADGRKERLLIMVNFSSRQVELTLPQRVRPDRLLLSTHHEPADVGTVSRQVHLRPDEGRLVRLED